MRRSEVKKLQKALLHKGFNPGPIDGRWGSKTERAVIQFKKSAGLRARSYVGPLTKAALYEGRMAVQPNMERSSNSGKSEGKPDKSAYPVWLKLATSYLGLREYRGSKHNPKILEWWIKLGLPFRNDETPWCAGYACGASGRGWYSLATFCGGAVFLLEGLGARLVRASGWLRCQHVARFKEGRLWSCGLCGWERSFRQLDGYWRQSGKSREHSPV
ncbi:MAG: peptidoglycan-binding protein [Hyphomicrobiales bacterium]